MCWIVFCDRYTCNLMTDKMVIWTVRCKYWGMKKNLSWCYARPCHENLILLFKKTAKKARLLNIYTCLSSKKYIITAFRSIISYLSDAQVSLVRNIWPQAIIYFLCTKSCHDVERLFGTFAYSTKSDSWWQQKSETTKNYKTLFINFYGHLLWEIDLVTKLTNINYSHVICFVNK